MKLNRRKELEHKKQELKEDIFVESVTKVYSKAAAARNYVLAGVIALALGFILISVMAESGKGSDESGWTKLAVAEAKLEEAKKLNQDEPEALVDETISQYGKLIEATKGSGAQQVALLHHIAALFEKGGSENIAKVVEECDLFLKSNPNGYFSIGVRQLKAKALFEQKEWQSALSLFDEVRITYKGTVANLPALEQEAAYYTGRCYEELNEPDKAREIYKSIAGLESSPTWAELAKYRLSILSS
ncbi:MAG TPA: tetratricopeptide repeat protein [Planctomycetota bacterium]|nr:tetratricopeptide repeat protein [Planctomycetota bacterium]